MTDTVVVYAAAVAAVPPTLAVLLAMWKQAKSDRKAAIKLQEVHVLVNSRLTEALDEIAELKSALSIKTGSRVPKTSAAKKVIK